MLRKFINLLVVPLSGKFITLLAVPFFGLGFFLMAIAVRQESKVAALTWTLFSMACLVTGSLIIAPLLAEFLTGPFGSIFFRGGNYEPPQPPYSLAQAKRKKGLYEEALTEYEKIALQYQDEVKPYIEMIDIAIVNLRDPALAAKIFRRGLSQLFRRKRINGC